MRLLPITFCMASLLTATACKTQRTVLAGPTQTGVDASGNSGDSRFSNQDPSGYLQNSSQGENAMSGKMFGGKLDSQTNREFKANKEFLTREYGSTREIDSKTWKGGPQGRQWTDQLFDTTNTRDQASTYRDAGKEAAVNETGYASQTARTRDYSDGTRMARTNNYRPAEKALSDGRDNPKLTTAQPGELTPREREVRARITNSQATAADINQFLEKP